MKFVRSIVVAMVCFTTMVLGEDEGTVIGVVTDAQTRELLANVNIFVEGTHRGDVSNFAGEFSVSGVPAGLQTVRASILGYTPTKVTVQISPHSVARIEVILNEDEAIRLEEIVVSGSRANVYLQTDLCAQDIERHGPKDVGEFLRTLPGTSSIRKGGMAMDPVIRGFRQDQLNVQVDGGMKVWGACPNRMDPPSAHIQAEDLEKIEVLKGPVSVRFGPTFGAVVNLVMEKPEQFASPGVRTRIEGGYESNWDGKRTRATVTAGIPLADLFVSGGVKQFGAYEAGDGSEVQSGFRMNDYSLKVGLNASTQHRIQVTNRGSYMRDVYYPALPMDAFVDDTHMYALDYAGKAFGGILSSLAVKTYGVYVHHIMGNQWKPTFASLHAVADVESQTFGGRAEATLAPLASTLLYVGVDAYDLMKNGDRVRNFVAGPNAGKTFRDTIWQDSHIRDIGTFVEGRAFLGSDITTIAGIRVDNVHVKSDRPSAYFTNAFGNLLNVSETNVSGVAAVLYRLSPVVELRLGIGRGVRTADITERFVYIQPIGMDRYDYIGNPALAPEQNTQIELAANARLSQISMQASVFHSTLQNYISARIDPTVKQLSADVLGVKRFVNIADASMTGFEVSASSPLTSALQLDLSASYTNGQNRTDNETLPQIPPFSVVAALRFQQPEHAVLAELEGRFVARQSRISAAFQEQATPGFAVYSLRTGMQFFAHLNLTAAVNNIFNRAYWEHLNRKSKVDGRAILEPGRVFSVNLQFFY